jgi:hypothetical protein
MSTTRHGHAREQLAKDVEEFLANGGRIQKLPQNAAVREVLMFIGGKDGGTLPARPRKMPRRQP